MVRRIFVVLSAFIITIMSCCIVGCSNNFKIVCSIKYTTNGEIKIHNSTYEHNYRNYKIITKEKYDSAPNNKKVSSTFSGNLGTSHKVPKNVKNFHTIVYEKTNEDDLKRYYFNYSKNNWNDWYNKYIECDLVSTTYRYVNVKIKDDSTLVIRTYDSITNSYHETTYKVSSYSITYFQ